MRRWRRASCGSRTWRRGPSRRPTECAPGNGPALHAHLNTVEAFFCLSGRFAITWGDEAEHSVTLEPWDFIHVPKEVVRTFTNVGTTDGALLVIIQGNRNDFDDVVTPPSVVEQLEVRFGADVVARLGSGGTRFFSLSAPAG